MAIAAQRFKFLDDETNVAVKDFETLADNAVYNSPNLDALFHETSENLLSSVTGGDLIGQLKNSLPSLNKLDVSNIDKAVTDMLNQTKIQNAISSTMKMYNINPSVYPDAVKSLSSSMVGKYTNIASSVCSSDRLLNSILNNLSNSVLGQISKLLSSLYLFRLSNRQCRILSPTGIPVPLPSSGSPINLSMKPIDVLKYIEKEHVKTTDQPSNQNKESIWTSKDTYTYIKFPSVIFREKEILIVNKILMYRAIYYKYEKEINPASNPNIHAFNASDVTNLISKNQYQAARDNITNSTANNNDLKALSQQIRTTFTTDIEALSIAADIDKNLIQSYAQVEEKKYMYYLNRYFELMKEFVDNPTYINIIKNHQQDVNQLSQQGPNQYMPQESQDFYRHVQDLYDFYKANRYTLNTTNPESIYTTMVKNAPSSLTQSEIDILINAIPNDGFNPELDNNMPTTSDYLYA
jgi:hypothetical protein